MALSMYPTPLFETTMPPKSSSAEGMLKAGAAASSGVG
jgi:hypothetical protein